MSSSVHEQTLNEILAKKYAELYQQGQKSKAAGVILAAEAIGEIAGVSGEIVKDQAERDHFCEHPDEKIRANSSNFYCSECEKTLEKQDILERL